MKIHFYKYQGTGNDFVMIDNRKNDFPKSNTNLINKLCDRRFGVGADGLILLEQSERTDFKMVYFNADGNESSMCGNGGRCLVAFANKLGVINESTSFDAIDGLHHATVNNELVSLQMINVQEIDAHKSYVFLNTGSPHHIQFVENVNEVNVERQGRKIRNGAPYFEEGTNVNFTEVIDSNTLKVRTYERGVENETLSCGTGVTAAAIASNFEGIIDGTTVNIKALGGDLTISFERNDNYQYSNVILTGPAKFVFEGTFEL